MLLLVSSISSGYTFRQEVLKAEAQVEAQMTEQAKFLGSKTGSFLEFIYRTSGSNATDSEGANLVVSQMGGNPHLTLAMLLDEDNQVMLSTHYSLRDQLFYDTPIAIEKLIEPALGQARQTLAGQVVLSQDRQRLNAFYPVRLQPNVGELRSSQTGVLVLAYDLSALKQQAWRNALRGSLQNSVIFLGLGLFVWLFLDRTVTRRVASLVAISNQWANGYLGERVQLHGADELAKLASAFNQMADRLQQSSEATRQAAETEMAKQLATIEAAIDGIAILEGDRYQYVNPSHVKMFGYEGADELIGQPWDMLHSPSERKQFEQTVLPQLRRDRAWQGEVVATRKDGSTFAEGLSLTLTVDDLLICVCQDISDRKVIEAEHYNLSTRLSLAVKSGGIGIWEWDIAHEILTWDERMHELFGTDYEDFQGCFSDWSSRVHPEDLPAAEAHFQAAIAESKELDIEFRAIHPDGQVRHIKANGLIERNHKGEPKRMIGINFDISDRKKAEIEVMQALEQERELNEMKTRFISTTSHEFRTPLAVIAAKAELLQIFGDRLDQAEQQEYLSTILSYVDHTTNLIEDILTVNKVESGKITLNPTVLDIVEFSQNLTQEIDLSSPSHHCNFAVKDARPSHKKNSNKTRFDPKRMQQVLTNLLTNASKYSQGNGSATLQLELFSDHVEYHVIDQGIGIPEEDQRHLFEPFHRATNVGTIPGTGLGLSIAKQLVTLHQGTIQVKSTLGQGSCFTVKIPTQWQ